MRESRIYKKARKPRNCNRTRKPRNCKRKRKFRTPQIENKNSETARKDGNFRKHDTEIRRFPKKGENMNDFTTGITAYPAAVLYTAIAAVFITGLIKPFIKKRLSSATLGEKLYADKLSDACFYLLLALCAVGSCLTFPITRTPSFSAKRRELRLRRCRRRSLFTRLTKRSGLKSSLKAFSDFFRVNPTVPTNNP